jgi:Protein of unknown function DUF262
MQRPDRSSYTPLDFMGWREAKALVLAPKFQRREVWTAPAKAYLIDTLIRGMPVPPIYLRITQSEDRKRIVREVIDGQQRIAAVLDYLDNKYALPRYFQGTYAGKRFSQLDEDAQDAIRQFSFICEVFHGISDAEVLEIFSRLNTYSVQFNSQELRNGTYFGYFKQSAYNLAHEHLEFWRRHHIFSERNIARMLEVELTSELMIVQLDGIQYRKNSINQFYSAYDDEFKERDTIESRFRSTLDIIEESLGDSLKDNEFRRPPLFYSLFCSVFHRVFGLKKEKLPTPKKRLNEEERNNLQTAVSELSDKILATKANQPIPKPYISVVNASLRQTDNLIPRRTRLETLYKETFGDHSDSELNLSTPQ